MNRFDFCRSIGRRMQAKSDCPDRHRAMLRVEELESRLALATTVSPVGPTAVSSPGQIGTGTPGIAIPSPVPTAAENQTSNAGFGHLQGVNDVTLVFNHSLDTTALPATAFLPLQSTLSFPPTAGFDGFNSPYALSSLAVPNRTEPSSYASLAAYIAVLSAASASVPSRPMVTRTNTFSRYPEAPDEQERRRIMEAVWTVLELGPVGQPALALGLLDLVAGDQGGTQATEPIATGVPNLR